MKVYVAVLIQNGVLEGIEVYSSHEGASAKVAEWEEGIEAEDDVAVAQECVIRSDAELDSTPLRELGLPRIYERRLRYSNINTVEALCEHSEWSLYGVRLIGSGCIKAVKDALAAKGLLLVGQ